MSFGDRKSVIVTGAGSGFGWATCLALLREGYGVVGVERDPDRLHPLSEAAVDHDEGFVGLQADVTEADAPARSVALALSRFGRLDGLVNNAGLSTNRALLDTDDAMLDLSLNVMLRAPFRFAREAIASMEQGGSIVNVASTFALLGGLRGGSYSVAKAGIIGLTQNIACDYGARGIRSNAVAPGVIPTGMTAGKLEIEEIRRMNVEMTPAKGWGTIDDVVNAIVFLCSDNARWINGQVIAIDGGWSTTKYLSEEARFAERVTT